MLVSFIERSFEAKIFYAENARFDWLLFSKFSVKIFGDSLGDSDGVEGVGDLDNTLKIHLH